MSVAASCRRCESPVEGGDLRCAICGETVPAGGVRREAVAVDVHRCKGCGAAVEYDPAARAPRCAFCDRVMEVERIEDPVEQTEAFLPFTVEAEEARAALREWLGGLGFFRPGDLTSEARVEELQPVWWVAWVFDADALISWTADSDAGHGRSSWAPHAGQVRMVFDDVLVSASRGLSEPEAAELTPSYDLKTKRAEPGGAEGAIVERFDVQRSQARRRIVESVHAVAAKRVEAEHVPGSTFRNVHVEALVRGLDTRRLAFPAWVLAYRYRDALYRVVVSGQDASFVHGKAPWSVLRILLVAAAVLAFVLVVLSFVAAAAS